MNNSNIDEDFQAWETFKYDDSYLWLFNKLEVALRQDLHAGPAGTAPSFGGTYIYRPAYNLYGMGIGTTKFEYNKSMYSQMINNGVVPPGSFWCQWLDGDHVSIDYEYRDEDWHTRSVLVGEHESKENLTKLSNWVKDDPSHAPTAEQLNMFYLGLPFFNDRRVVKFNVEMIGDLIIEIHLRWGNDPFDEYPVGTKIIPVWNDEEAPEGEWKGNLHTYMEKYSASGHLPDVRRGYVIKRPS